MEYKSFKCPECGANIDNINASFCSSCGVKLHFDDGSKNINIHYKNEDVAKIKEVEANKEIKIKENQAFYIIILAFIILPIIVLVLLGIIIN